MAAVVAAARATRGGPVPADEPRAYRDGMRWDATRGALGVWTRSELRRRWLSLVVLGVLGGLAAGLALAAIGGARRTQTAYTRMRSQLLASDAVFFPSQVDIGDADITKL